MKINILSFMVCLLLLSECSTLERLNIRSNKLRIIRVKTQLTKYDIYDCLLKADTIVILVAKGQSIYGKKNVHLVKIFSFSDDYVIERLYEYNLYRNDELIFPINRNVYKIQ